MLRASLEKADDEDLPEAFRRRTLSRVKSMKRKGTTTSVAVASFLTKVSAISGDLILLSRDCIPGGKTHGNASIGESGEGSQRHGYDSSFGAINRK